MPEEEERAASWVAEARAALEHPRAWRERLAKVPSFHPRELVALAALVAVIGAGAGIAFVRALPRSETAGSVPAPAASRPSTEPSGAPVVVYVAGAVRSPGVYEFPEGSRVIDALERAGGPAPGADFDALNLAQPLTDGSKLYVPREGEAPPAAAAGGSGGSSAGGGKVNLNTASVSELDAGLPGVGPVLAQRIVDYRTEKGPFRDVRDLLKVDGIGQKRFESLKDLVTV